jgi:hypothetical protein
MDQVQLLRQVLKGEQLVRGDTLFDVVSSHQHGHVQAMLKAMKGLRFRELIASQHTRERDLVVAMVVARILEPESKLATTPGTPGDPLPGILTRPVTFPG